MDRANYSDPTEELEPQLFVFDASAHKIKDDDYKKDVIFGYAENEYMDIKFVATLDGLYRPDNNALYSRQPLAVYHVQED